MIKRGLSVKKENENGDTPLHVAAKAGHVPVCQVLIACGADVLARNKKNRTPRSQIKVNGNLSTTLVRVCILHCLSKFNTSNCLVEEIMLPEALPSMSGVDGLFFIVAILSIVLYSNP